MTTTTIDKYADVIDSRDVIARIEELEHAYSGTSDEPEGAAEELAALKALAAEAADYSDDWGYGATLIRDSYFKEYAQELAEDIGALPANASWPNNCIDWDQAARELQMDYTSVEFDGVTYWVR